MIIYAFYGCGKTRYCKTHNDGIDLDAHIYHFMRESLTKSYADYVNEMDNDDLYIFVNQYVPNIRYAVFPANFERHIVKIEERKQGNFIPTKDEYEDMIDRFERENVPIIYLGDNDYLSNLLILQENIGNPTI